MGQSGPEAPYQTLNSEWYYWLEEWGVSLATSVPPSGNYTMISLYFEDISDVKVVPSRTYPRPPLFSVVVEVRPLTSTITINRCQEGHARFLLKKIKPHLHNVTVSIYDNYFSPKSITIPVGTSVTFVNKGEVTHNVTAEWGGFMDIKPGSSPWTVPFGPASAGKTYSYYDEYYPGMEGSITFAGG